MEIIRFNVAKRLATAIIIGWDFCNEHIEAIRPRKCEIELADGTVVPIIRQPDKSPPDAERAIVHGRKTDAPPTRRK